MLYILAQVLLLIISQQETPNESKQNSDKKTGDLLRCAAQETQGCLKPIQKPINRKHH
jgi:hypothetical protein